MREYARVSPLFWTGETGRQIRSLGPRAQVVALYLLTCPSANMLGMYYLPLPTLCHETGSPFEGASKALRSLSEAHFAYYDPISEYVWVPEMARFQIGEVLRDKDHRIAGIRNELRLLVKCPFFSEFHAKYREAFSLPSLDFFAPNISPFEAPSKPLRSQATATATATDPDLVPLKTRYSSIKSTSERQNNSEPDPNPDGAAANNGTGNGKTGDSETGLTPNELAEGYNRCVAAVYGLPVVHLPLTAERAKKARGRIHEHPEPGFWTQVFGCWENSRFLRGENGRAGWRGAGFDFLVRNPENVLRIVEGVYGDGRKT